ncbi:alpha-D-glucose phosphate-specific phosphoglucomutase [Streptomyces sp. UH6]|uniref:alpha-D-glucose phosphate-specific phosphoglucomutase n=1 Tax=Streptomyces sp. UH6 TaxID=2748379 RepID=UPI0015D4A179|nr:alpha-D-glucose phosphate-specific phosphoglucomutase [Streptomyces sp. UH6]NYV75606.1 alpha-D-glucose phosphate-specific phosphoglucomutase [Streptomyces sp. UH6]
MQHEQAGTGGEGEREPIDVSRVVDAYHALRPDPGDLRQRVVFGTNGHRGSALDAAFNDDHIAAISQAVVEYRAARGVTGPLFLGADPHALSEPARITALEVFAANGVTVLQDTPGAFTPTPAVSHAVLAHNLRHGRRAPADGVVITPSHNPPGDGGFKYNEPHGGPASTTATAWIERRANELLAAGLSQVRRVPYARARDADTTGRFDFLGAYVDDLSSVLDLEAVRASGIRIGADPLGGASVAYWGRIAERYGLDLTVLNERTDPTWRFLAPDHDGQLRTDCSSPHTMAPLTARRDRYDVTVANDADADRHSIVTPDGGLLPANHYLAVAVPYLHAHRDGWPATAGIGKSVVTSGLVDRVTAELGRPLVEMPVGFKWFTEGLRTGQLCWGGEESAGASFLRRDGSVWTTDKDGIVPALLAAEIIAVTGSSPSELWNGITERLGRPSYVRVDTPAGPEEKAALGRLSADRLPGGRLAGEDVESVLTHAPGSGTPLGGIKVTTRNAWFAARPSGTENVQKVYAESFLGPDHLDRVLAEAREMVEKAIRA